MKKNWQIPVTIVFVFLGLMFSFQFQTQSRVLTDLTMQRTEHLITMVRNLSDKRSGLAQELESLDTKLLELRFSGANEANILRNLNAELEKLNLVNGATEVTGPGITVTIGEEEPILFIDLISLVNELWAAGAEAIAINEKRVVYNTKIFYDDDNYNMYVTVNHIPLSYPIVISAIGNPNTLDKGLTLPGGIMDNLALFHAYPEIQQVEEVIIPSLKREITFSEAKETKK